MHVTASIDFLSTDVYFVTPNKPVSPVPLVFVTFSVEKAAVAYTTENVPKLARKYERQVKHVVAAIAEKNQTYLTALDQDQVLTTTDHVANIQGLVASLQEALAEVAEEWSVIRMELAGSWPVFQTTAGRLDLSE